jgi:hypothetical protein
MKRGKMWQQIERETQHEERDGRDCKSTYTKRESATRGEG